ncbi:methyl-accepting chemotaxis sensory transducer with Pas/Pac sensor [Formivibrio citricus]|uniref:Methyl-accepting chemotaxis sensory transducer with Pas/Pac sensor n=1 Tax=Formivibrio citricus TaxID=83765 RepID=A0A1I5DE04_9NEIS|nr:PAS domain-containing methyl-accepting chemotaxis protein [Formivibrio citricus]SFN97465.1 methyl-accepting chemotaxis sensory transducer with Pas/Pac sensor [Formivibrio citricus]
MKVNLPVTQQEVPYPQGMYVVSQTDLKGVITDANEAFVKLSGFTREELIGKSHNVVRHPDVPPAIFADMWASLKAGMPWRAVVKNRCKNGDHYWVDAQIVPIFKNDQIVGYMSVRREPTRQQIQESEALFEHVRKTGKFKSINRHPVPFTTAFFSITGFVLAAQVANLALHNLAIYPALENVFGIASLLSVIGLAGLFYVRRVRGAADLGKQILQMTQCELAHRNPIYPPDELGKIANGLQVMQTQWLVSIDHIKDALRDARQSIQAANQQADTINHHINSQHDRVASVAAATEEFCQAVAEVAGSAGETAKAAAVSEQRVAEGQKTVQDGMAAAEMVVGAVNKSHSTITELDRAVAKIGDITQVIKEIAEQTNLLALNAAIEAARAGESGRGFAVVADEVRKLAERTSGSTQEINKMVSDIQTLAGGVVTSMSEAAQAVETSSGKMHESVDRLGDVAIASRQTVGLAEHIASASDQQSIAGQEVARNMEVISQLSEENQALLRKLWQSMDELRTATAHVDETVNVFRLFNK